MIPWYQSICTQVYKVAHGCRMVHPGPKMCCVEAPYTDHLSLQVKPLVFCCEGCRLMLLCGTGFIRNNSHTSDISVHKISHLIDQSLVYMIASYKKMMGVFG